MLFLLVFEFMIACIIMYLFTGILELDDYDDCVEPTRERRRICNDGVPSGCSLIELEKLAYR